MSNTGYKAYTNLEQYYLDNGVATGVTKPNTIGDPDYVAPVLDLTYCPLPSATPSVTPTVSVTPSISPSVSVTPTITPTATPSVTPTISVTPSVPASVSVTPSISVSISVTPTITTSPSPTPTATPSTSLGFAPNVIAAQGYTDPCGGGCNEYLGWYITLDQFVAVDTNYTLSIELYNQYGVYQYTYTAYGTIPAGSNTNSSDPCLGGGTYIGCGYVVNNTCVATIDAPVNRSSYAC